MRISFIANSFFNDTDGDITYGSLQSFTTGDVETQEHYLNFQRNLEPGDRDGVYAEYNGQEYGGFNAIATCLLLREKITINLAQQLGNLEDVDGFDIALEIEDEVFEEIEEFLSSIFQGYENTFFIKQ